MVEKIHDRLMNASFHPIIKKKRVPIAETSITTESFFKYDYKHQNKKTSIDKFGPGNSIRGVSDGNSKTLYSNEFKTAETIYGRKVVKNHVDSKR